MPRVSVIVPTYNCAEFLGRALDSAFAQTYLDYEVIVADDGSTDDTRELVARDSRPLIYAYQQNRGLSAARNLAISKASGEFLAYLDSDDMWFPNRLQKQVEFMDANPDCGLVHSEVTVIDECDAVIHERFKKEANRPILRGHCAMAMLRTASMHVPSVLERTRCFRQAGPFDERLRSAEDYLHWLQVLLRGHSIGYIEEPLAMYRWRTGSLSRNENKMHLAMVAAYRILLEECELREKLGKDAEDLVLRHIEGLHYGLAHSYRLEGRNDLAQAQARELIRRFPLKPRPYVELLKSLVPPGIGAAIRSD